MGDNFVLNMCVIIFFSGLGCQCIMQLWGAIRGSPEKDPKRYKDCKYFFHISDKPPVYTVRNNF